MARVRKADTKPELAVRSLCHRLGYRFRLHYRHLPGTPDLVFPRLRKLIFVHGCFWHQHGCGLGPVPRSRQEYWVPKLERNASRDRRVRGELMRLGWRVLIVWECETRSERALAHQLEVFLEG
ncbi:MAG: DNA mismatch endonuclease Vsr [Alphaproteobacteria bacterium]|nr:DNA mismatch endonuclease Vsr [Alphaproteobacteria bacterium]